MNVSRITIPLKRFILIEECPAAWKNLDLYVFRDEAVAFYVGQSQSAFSRVWDHLIGGFHGHSIVGRFMWSNWPRSMRFSIDLLSSQSEEFQAIGNSLDAAERELIQRWSPCFNVSQNMLPSPLPDVYRPVNAKLQRRRGLHRLRREAERALRAEDAPAWVEGQR